jgi:hypothetical protein
MANIAWRVGLEAGQNYAVSGPRLLHKRSNRS